MRKDFSTDHRAILVENTAARENLQVLKQWLEVSARNAIETERLDSEYLGLSPLSITSYSMCSFSESRLSFLQNDHAFLS